MSAPKGFLQALRSRRRFSLKPRNPSATARTCSSCGRPEVWQARAGRPFRESHPALKTNRFPACEVFAK